MDNSIHFFNGALSGVVGVLISHPFDTLKTNLQQNFKPNLTLRSLYRGIVPPLMGVGFEKAVVFGTYTNCSNYLKGTSFNKKYIDTLAGAASGLAASFIVTPFERIKIVLQSGNSFKIKESLNRKYLFKGLSATFTRETPGFMIYFSVYNSLKERFYLSKNKDISKIGSFFFGGASGAIAWMFIYPQDLIKTKMQSVNNNDNFLKILKTLYNEGGIKSYYKGFHFALMRAVPLHAGTFMMMEILKKYHKS